MKKYFRWSPLAFKPTEIRTHSKSWRNGARQRAKNAQKRKTVPQKMEKKREYFIHYISLKSILKRILIQFSVDANFSTKQQQIVAEHSKQFSQSAKKSVKYTCGMWTVNRRCLHRPCRNEFVAAPKIMHKHITLKCMKETQHLSKKKRIYVLSYWRKCTRIKCYMPYSYLIKMISRQRRWNICRFSQIMQAAFA